MNKKFAIILSVVSLVLVALLIVLAALRSKPQSDSTDQFAAPTDTPINREGNRVYNSNSAIPIRSIPIPTLPKEKQEAFFTFQKFLPFNSDALAVDYLALTNKVYIEKKNENADKELQKFLKDNGLEEIFKKHPELFKTVSSNIHEQMNEEQEAFTELDLQSTEPNTTPAPSLSYDQQRQRNQTSAFNSLIKNLMSFKMLEPASQDKSVISLAGGNTISNSDSTTTSTPGGSPGLPSQVVEGAQVGSYKMRVKWDWENNERLCKPQPGTLAIVAYLQKKFGSSASYGINSACKTGTGKVYAHLAGRAVDYSFLARDPAKLKRGNEVFAWLLTNAQNVGIQYIKYWRVHWSPGAGIHCVDNTITPKDMYNHSDHIHFELNLAAAQKQTPFFTRGTSAPASMIINQEICPQLDTRMQ